MINISRYLGIVYENSSIFFKLNTWFLMYEKYINIFVYVQSIITQISFVIYLYVLIYLDSI